VGLVTFFAGFVAYMKVEDAYPDRWWRRFAGARPLREGGAHKGGDHAKPDSRHGPPADRMRDVRLRHPDGRLVTCEPGWRYGVIGATVGHDQVRDCVKDYQRQGFERVP